MSEKRFKDDLENCIINLQQRILITDLMNQYEMPHQNIQRILEPHIAKELQNFVGKCEKRYMVHGFQQETNKEVLTVVTEAKLAQTMQKLNKAASSLFSVELSNGNAGGKTAAQDLKLLRYYAIGFKDCRKSSIVTKVMQEKPIANENNLQVKAESKKPAEKPVVAVQQKPVAQKKAPIAKKANDFFKKGSNAKKPAAAANQSMQLFDDEDDDDVQVPKENAAAAEMHDANKRQITDDEEQENMSTFASKRRRIIDSDDEAEQAEQTNVKAACDKSVEETSKSGTFLDEDGFVVTIKAKTSTIVTPRKSPRKQSPIKKSPIKSASKIAKTSAKTPKKSPTKTKTIKKAPAKTKQGSIMKFFSKT